ncbi:MAG: SMP-30/gluconolactonase/LRE family protein [Sphingobacteriales bacterium]|nr:MAG: SMP-30/gluconolactonase/LRE family protein [Sphingobacteriales bacterium]
MKIVKAQIESEQQATLGEGPVWDAATGKLYWIDIKSKKVYRYDPVTKSNESWQLAQMVGCIVVVTDEKIRCALQDQIVELNTTTGEQNFITALEAELPDNRSNDGKADAAGRFWVGTLHMPGENGKAALYRIEKNLSVSKAVAPLGMSNGLGWSPDNKTMYLVDTPAKHVLKFDFSLTDGLLTNKEVVLDLQNAAGSPDGMCVDIEGNLWIAFYGGKRVACYNPATGKQLAEVTVPAVNVTCCTFGGKDLDTMFITTARDGLSEDDLQTYPDSGSLFTAYPGVKGLPANRVII